MWKYTPPTNNYASAPTLAPGNYRARISEIKWDISKSGKDMLVITFIIPATNSKIRDWKFFDDSTPQAINRSNFYFKRFCDAFNLNPEDINNPEFDLSFWVGQEGGIIIENIQRNGGTYPRIKDYLSRKQFQYFPPAQQQQQPQQQQFYSQPQQQPLPQQQQGNSGIPF